MNRIGSETAVREFRVLRLFSVPFAVLILGRPVEADGQTTGVPFKIRLLLMGRTPGSFGGKRIIFSANRGQIIFG